MSHRARRGNAVRVDDIASVFSALGDETRLKLVSTLSSGGAKSITELTVGSGHTRQAVTKHLRVLSSAGLVLDEKSGRERLWKFEPDALKKARRSLENIASQWDGALDRLRQAVED